MVDFYHLSYITNEVNMNIKYITQLIPKPILAVLVFGYMIGLYVVCPLVTIVVAIKWLLKF